MFINFKLIGIGATVIGGIIMTAVGVNDKFEEQRRRLEHDKQMQELRSAINMQAANNIVWQNEMKQQMDKTLNTMEKMERRYSYGNTNTGLIKRG